MVGVVRGAPAELTPEEWLAEARRLAGRGHEALGTTAARASALLGRTALEEAIWSCFPTLRAVSGRTMLVTLNGVLRDDTARRATLAWHRLSAISHHDAYELPPTPAELTTLLDTVHDVVEAIAERRSRTPAGAPGS